MSQGYIKLHRKSLDSRCFANENVWKVWCYILLSCTESEHEVFKKVGNGSEVSVSLQPGQMVWGSLSASKRLGMNRSTVRRCLSRLEGCKNVTLEANHKYTVVSVCNWASYQCPLDEGELWCEPQTGHIQGSSSSLVSNTKLLDSSSNLVTSNLETIETTEEKEKKKADEDSSNGITPAEIKKRWNSLGDGTMTPKMQAVSPRRQGFWRGREAEGTLDLILQKLEASDYLMNRTGERGRWFDPSWPLRPSNAEKILEGKYDNSLDEESEGGYNADTLAAIEQVEEDINAGRL